MIRAAIKRALLKCASGLFPSWDARIVYYHDFGLRYTNMGTPESMFKGHVKIVKELGYSFVPSVIDFETGSGDAARRKLQICFDDGFRGLWDYRDYLVNEGISPTVFLAIDLVGKPGYLTWDEIRHLHELGFTFQSHTYSHRSLTAVPDDELKHELLDSRKMISDRLGKNVDSLCFPRGLFSKKIIDVAAELGYVNFFTCIPGSINTSPVRKGLVHSGCNVWSRNIAQNASVEEFRAIIRGAMDPFSGYYRLRHFKQS